MPTQEESRAAQITRLSVVELFNAMRGTMVCLAETAADLGRMGIENPEHDDALADLDRFIKKNQEIAEELRGRIDSRGRVKSQNKQGGW